MLQVRFERPRYLARFSDEKILTGPKLPLKQINFAALQLAESRPWIRIAEIGSLEPIPEALHLQHSQLQQ